VNSHAETPPTALCAIGVAQRTHRDAGAAGEPLDGWEQVARAAAADSGRSDLLGDIESLQVVYCQSWPYDDPVGRLADRLGAAPAHRLYSGIGGTTPQVLVNATAETMLRGEVGLALIVSGEALATVRQAKRAGERLAWSHRENPRTPFPWEPPPAAELAHEVFQAWETFPLWDTARRARAKTSLEADAQEAASVMAALSVVAAGNPHAWRPTALTAEEVGAPGRANRYVGWPYTKNEVAVMDVDMSAAVLLATHERADVLGIAPERRVYLRGWSYAEDPAGIAARADLSRSAAMAVCGAAATEAAGIDLADLSCFDLYSCFPSSVRLGCDALGLDLADPRGLTVTGGLPYAGGPGSGYVLHAIAAMVERLRTAGGSGLVTGVGMHLAKHVAAVWSSTPPERLAPPDYRLLQQEVHQRQPCRRLLDAWEGDGVVAAYTVAHDREGAPQVGLLVLDTEKGRALARVHDVARLHDAESRELVGQEVSTTSDGRMNEARW
jgi:acetyl-CoA C-acetyltransferase